MKAATLELESAATLFLGGVAGYWVMARIVSIFI
jgi:hypothetical protein